MKVCTVEHEAPGFGTIPVGSIWAEDSPFIIEADCFAEIEAEGPIRPRPTRHHVPTVDVDEAPTESEG